MRNRSPHNQLAVILTLWVMRREPSVERGAWTGRDERRAFGSTTQRRFSIQVELLDSPFT
jgi:hypothetical protein